MLHKHMAYSQKLTQSHTCSQKCGNRGDMSSRKHLNLHANTETHTMHTICTQIHAKTNTQKSERLDIYTSHVTQILDEK